MNIMVRVYASRAQRDMEMVRARTAAISSQIDRNNRMQPLGQRHLASISKFGNQLQWTGRMLQYNFTLPLLAAGAAAVKWQLDNEKAATHVAKVYGDTTAAVKQYKQESNGLMTTQEANAKATATFNAELDALDGAFTAISNHYGVQKKAVLEVAGAWAAAGASGRDLAEATKATMDAIIIGDMDAAAATKSLISIQAQYNLSTAQLNATLADLNAIENATGIDMQGLIDGFARAGGVARAAGVGTRELAAELAALSPAAGSAANAGNALKTIYSRLMAPTKESTQVLSAMGIEVEGVGWQSLTASEKLHVMAGKFTELHAAQKNAVSTTIASRWQLNKFSILMEELASKTGYYEKALSATEHQGQAFKTMQKELNAVLESDPRKLQRMWVMLQNAMTEVIQPIIPFILYLAQSLADLANAFADLNPHLQKFILLSLLVLAAVGPLVRYIGALTTLYGVFFISGSKVVGMLVKLARMLFAVALPFKMLGTVAMDGIGLASRGIQGLFLVLGTGVASVVGGVLNSLGLMVAAAGRSTILISGFFGLMSGAWNTTLFVMVSSWTTALAKMVAGAALSTGAMSGTFTLMYGAILTGMKFWVIRMLGLMVFLGTRLEFIWGALWTRLAAFSEGVWLAMLAVFSVIRGGYVSMWLGMHELMAAISASFGKAWLALQVLLTRSYLAVQAASARAWTAITGAAYGLQAAMSRAFWSWMIATYIAGALRISAIWTALSINIVATTKKAMIATAMLFVKVAKFLTGPWGIAIAIITGLMYKFRDQLVQIWNNIVSYFAGTGGDIGDIWAGVAQGIQSVFHMLPESVQGAMMAVVGIVRSAALAVYDWFSYINPFAHHSPSLVENVTRGMDVITAQFKRLSSIKNPIKEAYAEVKKFGALTAQFGISAAKVQQTADRKTIRKAGGGDAVVNSYNRLIAILNRLTPILKKYELAMNAQQAVVDRWAEKLDKVNAKLDRQQKILDRMQGVLDGYQAKLDAAQDSLATWASTPIEGMQAMSDKIFDNEMAQKRLRLEMMKMEDVTGPLDQIKSKIEAINGAQEMLRGEQAAMRSAGAGSEILGYYDQQITALDAQRDAQTGAAEALQNMQDQLDELGRTAERLDLENSLAFDPLTRQIDQAANAMEEMPFDTIMAGITGSQAAIVKWTAAVDSQTAKVAEQQAVVDKLIATRDHLQSRYDHEQAQLDAITKKYNNVNDAIQAVNSSINDVTASAEKLNQALDAKKKKKASDTAGYVSPGLQNFLNAGSADFPDPGGKGIPPRTDWTSQVDSIDDFTKDLQKQTTDAFASINPFAPLVDKAKSVWGKIKSGARKSFQEMGDIASAVFKGVSIGDGGDFTDKLRNNLEGVAGFLTSMAKSIAKPLKWAWDLFGDDLKELGSSVVDAFKDMWKEIGPELEKFGPLIKPLGEAISNIWAIAKPILAVLVGGLLLLAKVAIRVLATTLGPLLKNVGRLIAGLLRVIRGVFEVIIGILTLDWKMAWQGVKDIVTGTLKAIWAIIKGVFGAIWHIVKGFVEGVVGFFKWLYDVLVGHSIVPDLVDKIKWWFGKLADLAVWVWDNVLKPIVDVFVAGYDLVVAGLGLWWEGVKFAWNTLTTASTWVWDHVLKPVYDKVHDIWKDWIKPAFAGWWTGIKAVWETWKNAGQWVWDHILSPVYNKIVNIWKDWIKPAFAAWWAGVKLAWETWKNAGQWVWDNVLSPILTKIKTIWKDWIKPELEAWWGRIKTAWDGLTNAGEWIKNHVMDPVLGAFKTGWTAVKTWFSENSDTLLSPIKTTVRGIIGAINWIIKGLNKLDALPGVKISISELSLPDKFAAGGIPSRKVGGGFKTTGARAIVGEGKANYPEYVIPTDPTYRDRARRFVGKAAKDLGMTQPIPAHASGGILGSIGGGFIDLAGDAFDKAKDLGKGAMKTTMSPFFLAANKMADGIDWSTGQDAAKGAIGVVKDWVGGADAAYTDAIAKEAKKRIPKGSNFDPGAAPWSRTTFRGFSMDTGQVKAILAAEKQYGGQFHITQGSYSTGVKQSGTTHAGGGAFDMTSPVNVNALDALRDHGQAAWIRNPSQGDWPWHIHSIMIGDPNLSASAAAQVQSYLSGGIGLKDGGIVKRSVGGTLARIGEGSSDEMVTPLPNNWKPGDMGKREYHFHGDLSFPNITSPDDAKTFFDNLDNLSKD